MKPTRLVMPALVALAAVALVWLLFVGLPPLRSNRRPQRRPPRRTARRGAQHQGAAVLRRRRWHVADGRGAGRPFGENTVEQAKAIVGAQIAPAAEPLVSAIPTGTTLRALFITRGGEAYVDLSGELVTGHPGGSTNELLTIRTLVDALTANLPAITAVQLLVDGKELDTLAGHVDLRRPFARKVQ